MGSRQAAIGKAISPLVTDLLESPAAPTGCVQNSEMNYVRAMVKIQDS
jgi:hypothetical protein